MAKAHIKIRHKEIMEKKLNKIKSEQVAEMDKHEEIHHDKQVKGFSIVFYFFSFCFFSLLL